MKWVIFTGTWRLTNKEVENDVRNAVRNCISNGYGVVTGGATGVDYFAMDECVKNSYFNKLRIFIPADVDHYINDYYKNWCHEPITKDDILNLKNILLKIQEVNPASLLEIKHDGGDIIQDHYNERHNLEIIFSADEVYAFQVNNSTGTGDTINKARASGLPITLHKQYIIEDTK